MNTVRVVIAEDSLVMRDLLERTLSRVDGLLVVGTALDGDEAVRLVRKLEPHILVLDIVMPRQDGLAVLREVREDNPALSVIMFTGEPSLAIRRICLEAGANHYLDKSRLDELVQICKQEVAGKLSGS